MIEEVLKQTVVVTGFVMVMMLVIEYLNIRSHGNWSKWLETSPVFQLFFAAILGTIPGCIGTYTLVSLYTHNIVSFGALMAAMIATIGDEALVMYSLIPNTALKLNAILISLGLIVGFITNKIVHNRMKVRHKTVHFVIHEHHAQEKILSFAEIIDQLRNISFQRFLLILGHVLFIIALVIGWLGHDHHGAEEAGGHVADESWVNYIFTVLTLVGLFIVSTVSEHFLSEHLWEHIIRKHFLRIFLWTLTALFAIHLLMEFVNLEAWIKSNPILTLFLAILSGSLASLIFLSVLYSNVPFMSNSTKYFAIFSILIIILY